MLRWCGWSLLAVATFAATGACTKQNPRSCADGACNDIAFPFCDVDGTLQGEPNTCIAVSCIPGELEACRGDEAITCNAAGNNFDVTQCERGCDEAGGGCKGCENNDQCTNPTPICDTGTSACRACQTDSECSSQVCDTGVGACVAEASIVYASPTGAPVGSCTLADPCTLARAVTVATTAAVTPTLRLLPGTFLTQLNIAVPTPAPLRIVATGATVAPTNTGNAVQVSGGANVEIRNLTIDDSNAIVCDDATVMSTLSVKDSGGAGAIGARRCTLQLTNVDLTSSGVTLTGPVDFKADRIHLVREFSTTFGLFGLSVTVRVINSVFENIALSANTSDTTNPGSQISFAFSTFVFTEDGQHDCLIDSGSAHRTIVFENNVMKGLGSGGFDVVGGGACTLLHNILSPQATAPTTNLTVDPQLVNAAGHDYHLKSTSPAIDAAVPSTGIDPTVDFDGIARPQGAKKDLGAFEFKP
jgi:hypothetical protein